MSLVRNDLELGNQQWRKDFRRAGGDRESKKVLMQVYKTLQEQTIKYNDDVKEVKGI